MRIRILSIGLSILLLAASAAFGQGATKYTFTAMEVFDPFGILGAPVGAYLPPDPTISCPGHEPTGNPVQPCPTGSRTHVRNSTWRSRVISGSPGVPNGWMTVVANGNFDLEFNGPQWGTFSMVYDSGGGTFDGTWQTVRAKVGDHWEHVLHANGRITGGPFDGANARVTEQLTSFTPIPFAYVGNIEIRVVVPN